MELRKLRSILFRIKKKLSEVNKQRSVENKFKIFCVGMNKTGTTSLEKTLMMHGIIMGDQNFAQKLLYDYEKRNFKPIIEFCRTAQGFQDSPFSCNYLYVSLHQAFPNAKFILTVRSNEEDWYYSLLRFHSIKFGRDGHVPILTDLKTAKRSFGRTVYDNMKMRFNVSDGDIYNKEKLIDYYLTHNKNVEDYFRGNNNFLKINLSDTNSYQVFCEFLGFKPIFTTFPWENKSIKYE